MNDEYIVGVDEVGRGPLAGPVAVCAFVIKKSDIDKLVSDFETPLRDSKKLTERMREKWFEYLLLKHAQKKLNFATVMASASEIDSKGIVACITHCLNTALGNLKLDPEKTMVYLDGGLKAQKRYIQQETCIKGDELHSVISLASVVAKVTRDRLMIKLSEENPEYGFESHKGYGTKKHMEAIREYGVIIEHRRTFLKNI